MIGRTSTVVRQMVRHNKRLFSRQMLPSVQKAPDKADETDLETIRLRITYKEASEAEALFRTLDTDEDGNLTMDELEKGLRRFKLPTGQKQLKMLFDEIDTNKNGMIDLEEFTVFVEVRKDKLQKAYQWIMKHSENKTDEETHGFTAHTLRAAAKRSGVNLSDQDIAQIVKRLDEEGDAHVSYESFVNYMLLAPPCNPKSFLDSWYVDAFSDDAQSEFTIPREVRIPYGTDREAAFIQEVAKKLSCGGAAGCLSRTMTAPIDRLRILMMTSAERIGFSSALRQGMSGGLGSLWKGNGVNCIKITPEMAVKLFMFDAIKNNIAKDPGNVSMSERFVAGGLAGVSAQLSIYPMEVVKTRLAMAAPGDMSGTITNCARHILAQGGYRSFYAGVGPSIVGIVPYAAIDLSLNSILKDYAAQHLQAQKREASVPVLLGCGMISSGTAAVLTFPLNAIRTKAQATGGSFRSVFRSIQAQGWSAFYRGVVPSLMKVLPATSISYTAYEYLGGSWDRKIYQYNQR